MMTTLCDLYSTRGGKDAKNIWRHLPFAGALKIATLEI
jgi:hypothetical protein